MAVRKLFNDNWYFMKVKHGVNGGGNDGGCKYKRVDIPHDWLIYDAFGLYEDSTGFYKKEFDFVKNDCERVFFRFDGVYMDTVVYLNGSVAFEWKYGYSTFEFEATSFLVNGNNVIEVTCNFKSPNSRWYSGAGIYRNVWMITKPDVCIVSDGIYVSCVRQQDDRWITHIDTEIDMGRDCGSLYSLAYTITDDTGIKAAETVIENIAAGPDMICKVCGGIEVSSPRIWDVDSPHLYTLEASLYRNGRAGGQDIFLETCMVRFGYRQAVFTPDEGFILNGRKLKLNGVCNHHDLGALGAAFNTCAAGRQIEILKGMGVNAIRTSHNMAAPEFIELANEMGILVNAESFDMWECKKTEYDYSVFFGKWHERDVESWIRRDRNAPCIIMWSIGNEIYDTHKDERGQEITRNLMELVLRHDYRHNAAVTIGSNYMPWENAGKCADIVKLAGYNYSEKYYDAHHREHKDWIIYGSETAAIVSSRGIYHFPADVPILDEDDMQCSSLGNSTTSWGAESIDECITADRDAYYSAGMFLWSGFDYIGEPTPYHTKNSYFGQVDTAGFPKDSYYVYKAEWTDYRTEPMVHVYPYWDFNEGQIIDVMVCSNAPEVGLYVNGVLYGREKIDHKNGDRLVVSWKVPYHRGCIEAVAYDGNNRIIARDKKVSFSDAVKIVAVADKTTMYADGKDLIFVEISVIDKHGNSVLNANNRMRVDVTGEGRLVGLDNGDSTDYDSYKGLTKCLFSGKLLAVIAATADAGDIKVHVTSNGLEDAELILASVMPDVPVCDGISAIESNSEEYTGMWIKDGNEIPIRKIELISSANRLTNENPVCVVTARIYPPYATYGDVSWKVTMDNGVASNLAEVSGISDVSDKAAPTLRVRVTARGDGKFRLRCSAENGRNHAEVISEIEFEADGIGNALYDAYELISGSVYVYSEGGVSNGNERGVATPRDNDSVLFYDNIDFGDYGSDEIHIPIFELDSKPLEFEIWKGKPRTEGAVKLIDAVYDRHSVWNTYQEETYKLPERLKGTEGIGFVFHRKAHIKGFWFTKYNKAF